MLPRISAFLAVAIAVAASARMERHTHVRRGSTPDQCNTGQIKCCNSVTNVGFHRLLIDISRACHSHPRKASSIASVLDFLSYSYDPADSVGLDCTPFNIYGAGEATSCQQQPVCCSNNTYVSLALVSALAASQTLRWNPERRLLLQYRVFSDGP